MVARMFAESLWTNTAQLPVFFFFSIFFPYKGCLLQVLNCVRPEIAEEKHHTLWNNVITENSWEARVGTAVIRKVIFTVVICY